MTTTITATNPASPGAQRSPALQAIDAAILARVKAGMALLEREHGPGWVDKLDLAYLDLEDGQVCVLGQLYQDYVPSSELRSVSRFSSWDGEPLRLDDTGYAKGCAALGIDEWDDSYGFYAYQDRWDELQEAWLQMLTPRVSTP